MRARLTVDRDPGDELLSLYRWLADDDSVRRYGALQKEADQGATDSLGIVEVLSLAVGSGLSLAQLLIAVANWRSRRPGACSVRVEVDGVVVEVATGDPDQAKALAEHVEARLARRPEAS